MPKIEITNNLNPKVLHETRRILYLYILFVETFSCGVVSDSFARAPRCSLCQHAHNSNDTINNIWCDGDCWYDDGNNLCKEIGKFRNDSWSEDLLCIMSLN